MTVEEAQQRISSSEFAEWRAYDLLEPFGWDRLGNYFGTIAATIANTQRTKASSKVWTWKDFFPKPYEEARHQTVDEQIAIVEILNEAFGGVDLRER